jgi:hypothetical protein
MGDRAMGRGGGAAKGRNGETANGAAPIGRAKNSARRGPCLALCSIRAGFEPFRAASCFRKLSRTPTLLEENNRTPQLKTGATYRNVQETPWARRVFALPVWDPAPPHRPFAHSPIRRFAHSPPRLPKYCVKYPSRLSWRCGR